MLFELVLVSACSGDRGNRVVVGCKNFTEQLILGEILAQQLEAKTSLQVDRRFYLAGTLISQQAIVAGRIDIYPEYTGTALTAVLKENPSSDPKQVYDAVRAGYQQRFNLDLGPP